MSLVPEEAPRAKKPKGNDEEIKKLALGILHVLKQTDSRWRYMGNAFLILHPGVGKSTKVASVDGTGKLSFGGKGAKSVGNFNVLEDSLDRIVGILERRVIDLDL